MAAYIDLTIEQGATFTLELLCKDSNGDAIDLSGYTAAMDIRRSAAETSALLLQLTTANGRIIITAATGSVTLYLTATETAALDWQRGVYDLELISAGGDITRLAEGAVIVSANVTV